jgi:hypothetical protein
VVWVARLECPPPPCFFCCVRSYDCSSNLFFSISISLVLCVVLVKLCWATLSIIFVAAFFLLNCVLRHICKKKLLPVYHANTSC